MKLCPITQWSGDRECKREVCALWQEFLGCCGLIAQGQIETARIEQQERRAEHAAMRKFGNAI